jgi:hypothetical protein
MRVSTRVTFLVYLLLPCFVPSPVIAQWSAAIQLGSDRFWGGASDDTEEHRSFLPYRPSTFTAAVHHRGSRMGVGLRLGYSEAALGLEGNSAVVAAKGVFAIYSVAPDLSYRVATLGAGNSVLLQAGPLLELWSITDEGTRTRIGGHGGVALLVPVGGRFNAILSGSLAVLRSPFEKGELPEGFEMQTLWRRGIAGGLEYQF